MLDPKKLSDACQGRPHSQPDRKGKLPLFTFGLVLLLLLLLLITYFEYIAATNMVLPWPACLILHAINPKWPSCTYSPSITSSNNGLSNPTTANTTAFGPGELGAVASESSICSNIGIDLLRRGGNAADALVGTTFCIGVIGMYHSGIGGGGFLLVRGSDGEYEFVDFRETAPAAAFQDMYNNNTNASIYGGLAR